VPETIIGGLLAAGLSGDDLLAIWRGTSKLVLTSPLDLYNRSLDTSSTDRGKVGPDITETSDTLKALVLDQGCDLKSELVKETFDSYRAVLVYTPEVWRSI
jgi:hypothetical protein